MNKTSRLALPLTFVFVIVVWSVLLIEADSDHIEIVAVPSDVVSEEAAELELVLTRMTVEPRSVDGVYGPKAANRGKPSPGDPELDAEWLSLICNKVPVEKLVRQILSNHQEPEPFVDLTFRNKNLNPTDLYIDRVSRRVLHGTIASFHEWNSRLQDLYARTARKEFQYLLSTGQLKPLPVKPLSAHELAYVKHKYIKTLEKLGESLGERDERRQELAERVGRIKQDPNEAAKYLVSGRGDDIIAVVAEKRYRVSSSSLPLTREIKRAMEFATFECCGIIVNWFCRKEAITHEMASVIMASYQTR